MKLQSLFLVLALSFGTCVVNAQQFDGGVATYFSKTSFDFENFGGREMSEQMKNGHMVETTTKRISTEDITQLALPVYVPIWAIYLRQH